MGRGKESALHSPCLCAKPLPVKHPIALIGVEPAVKYSFVQNGTQTRLKGQYNAALTLSPRLHVKPLITAIRAITDQDGGIKNLVYKSNAVLQSIICAAGYTCRFQVTYQGNYLHLLNMYEEGSCEQSVYCQSTVYCPKATQQQDLSNMFKSRLFIQH